MDKLERVCTVATTLAAMAMSTRAFTLTLCVCQKFKEENPDNDAIKDNVAGQAYIEQFGQEVFSRADNAVRANKASKYAYILRSSRAHLQHGEKRTGSILTKRNPHSRQTADTFLAAATFLELCQIWGEVDPDIASKIKFAKYHAIRIAKAIKNGEDPNLSNPVVEKQTPDDELQALDPNDPEVRALQGDRPDDRQRQRQPSVEEIPDEADRVQRSLAQQSILNESLHPSRSSSLPRPASTSGTSKPDHLPTVPAEISLPSAPSDLTLPQTPSALPDKPKQFTDPSTALESFPPPAVVQMSHAADPAEQPPLPKSFTQHATSIPPAAGAVVAAAPAPASASMAPAPPASQATSYGITANDQAIAQAQKHAKWAVSALSFDDVPTAIKELKIALRQLGAE